MGNIAHTVDSEFPQPAQSGPVKWWQWVLVYPTLAVSLAGAVPTFREAVNSTLIGVPFGKSSEADEQKRLWEANFECTRKSEFQTIKNKRNVEIGSVVCDTGDVLLKGKPPDAESYAYRWVSWNTIALERKTALSFINSAYAADEPAAGFVRVQNSSVVCQRWVGNGLLLRRIAANRICFDELINTYNGKVMRRNSAPCQPGC